MKEIAAICEDLECLDIELKELVPSFQPAKENKLIQKEVEYSLKWIVKEQPSKTTQLQNIKTPEKTYARKEVDSYYVDKLEERWQNSNIDSLTKASPEERSRGEYSSPYLKYESSVSKAYTETGDNMNSNNYYSANVLDLEF